MKPAPAKLLIVALTFVAIAIALFGPSIAQSTDYHQFADQRTIAGVPNALNTLSNLAFFYVGTVGLRQLWQATPGVDSIERWIYLVFFSSIALVSPGSAYYHLAPDNARLFWDRLPMTLAFTSLTAGIVYDRVDAQWGRRLFPAMLLAGVASIVWWRWTESIAHENILPYVVIQAYAMLSLLLLALVRSSRQHPGNYLFAVIVLYLLAKGAEHFDAVIFSAMKVVSGHTLKHLLAALGAYCILLMLKQRRV